MFDVIASRDQAVAWRHRETGRASSAHQYLIVAAVVLGITLPSLFLRAAVGSRSIALIYLLGVVVLALFVGRGPTLVAATLSALFWDFFFLEPIAQFRIANAEDAIMLGMYFAVALILGQLTTRICAQEKAERQRERRSTALYDLTRELAEATDLDQMLAKVAQQTETAFEAQVALLLPDSARRLSYHPHPSSTYDISGPEQPAADWAFEKGQPAGRFTPYLPEVETLFVPLSASGGPIGVMGLKFRNPSPLTREQRNLLEAFSQHIALALDRHRLSMESEKAKLVAESERLSKALLNSVSHEIRTPLAAIKSATSTLVELDEPELSADQRQMISEIQEATDRLNNLVGKVLDITRLESGSVKPKLNLCDVVDLVQVAVKETKRELARHKVTLDLAPGLPLIKADFVLLQQALANLLGNAACHTPAGTPVEVGARCREGCLVLTVADRGPGIPPESIPRIFDKFYRAPAAATGGTGLGLSLVKGFVEAQGGRVSAENRHGGGALFTIRLPANRA